MVLDNLNTLARESLYEAFPAWKAQRIAKWLEFRHIPKHGSSLNPALSLPKGWRKSSSASYSAAVSSSVSPTRNPSAGRSTAWNWNEAQATINRRFSIQDARTELHRLSNQFLT